MKIKKIGILSLAKIMGVLYGIGGLILGIIISLVSLLGFFVEGDGPMALGVLGIIILPLLYGVMGFIGGVICSVLYNLCAKWVGGIEIEVEQ